MEEANEVLVPILGLPVQVAPHCGLAASDLDSLEGWLLGDRPD
jgi:hypothetical protein